MLGTTRMASWTVWGWIETPDLLIFWQLAAFERGEPDSFTKVEVKSPDPAFFISPI
jgi:hypothetical protein